MAGFSKRKFYTRMKELYGNYENFTNVYNQRFGADKKVGSVEKWGQPNNPNAPTRKDMINVALMLKMSIEELMCETDIKKQPLKYNVDVLNIPIISHLASAGTKTDIEGIETFDTIDIMPISPLYFKTPQKAENLRITKVDGHSMTPMLYPDTHLIFDITQTEYIGDGLYIINFRNILMVKLLQITTKGVLRIISTNKDYESYEVDIDDQSVLRIVGKVVKIII
jgi:phage repressor protein C with HTH and peptisase S24 domain